MKHLIGEGAGSAMAFLLLDLCGWYGGCNAKKEFLQEGDVLIGIEINTPIYNSIIHIINNNNNNNELNHVACRHHVYYNEGRSFLSLRTKNGANACVKYQIVGDFEKRIHEHFMGQFWINKKQNKEGI